MTDWLPWRGDDGVGNCGCVPTRADDTLRVDADACPAGGDLPTAPACRATVVEAIGDAAVDRVVVARAGHEAAYLDDGGDLLAAAGRFSTRVAVHDDGLAERVRRDPLGAAEDAAARADPIRKLAADSGLLDAAAGAADYDHALRPAVAPAVSDARFVTAPPPDARLRDQRELATDAVVRLFDRPEGLPLYHVEPLGTRLDDGELAALEEAADLLATGGVAGAGAAHAAARRAADNPVTVERVGTVLEKHTADLGVLVDCFADPAVTDVFASPPIPETPLRVRVDGELAATNVRLSERGARALASAFRRHSGRAFSRANPMLDAATSAGDRELRVAGTTDPVTDGLSFAIRAHDDDPWTLERLVANGTMPADAAAVLSVAVERGAAVLVAGPRGAGKTTLLGALLFELPQDVRTLLIEDTPELPTAALRDEGRDVQTLHTATGDGPGRPPAEVLRGALRLGEGAIAVGEVRGEEAGVLYEAMRVGASDGAVLGTIHGEGADSVRERVVSDLGVPESAFGTTDLVVTMRAEDHDGERVRRLGHVEEVVDGEEGVRFGSLYEPGGDGAEATGRIDRGASRLLATLAEPGEEYAAVRAAIQRRAERFERASHGRAVPC